jgi:methionyl-tRNA formyltransferase
MTAPKRFRLMFLGERRISWCALQLLHTPEFAHAFDLRVLVSNEEVSRRYVALTGDDTVRLIGNEARRTEEILAAIAAEHIDLLISVQYNWVLPPEVLDSVGRNAFNLHNARLPDYKGYHSVSHAILNGDTVFESTLHWMANKVDTGDAAFIGRTIIRPDDTARSLYPRTVDAAVDAFRQLITALSRGEPVPRTPLPAANARFYGRDSLRALADVTGRTDQAEVARIARALFFPPHQTAYFDVDGVRMRVIPDAACGDLTLFGPSVNQLDP